MFSTKIKITVAAFAFLCALPAEATLRAAFATEIAAAEPIRGTVISAGGKPIANAKIKLEEGAAEAVTDSRGMSSIEAAIGQTLTVEAPGYDVASIKITSASISVNLTKSDVKTSSLQEVVLVGYGSRSKSDLTGAITRISTCNFKQGVNVSADDMLQGKVAGVRIVSTSGEPGAGINVSVRSIGSIRSGVRLFL